MVPGASGLAARLDWFVEELVEHGNVRDPAWQTALWEVPRHLFIPDVGWAVPDVAGADGYAIDRVRGETAWLDAVYSNTGIVTQVDDGATDPAAGEGMFTSSASAPAVVCEFLELLAVGPGHRVLEIGTGTGWTAALLAHRVGNRNVVTVEIDPQVATWAHANLARAVSHGAIAMPTAITGDGTVGAGSWAPYDRVHVTCGVRTIPYAWVEQARPGGVIVAPFQPGYGCGHKLRLDVADSGTAVGRFCGPASYMMMRSQRPDPGMPASFLHHEDDADHSFTMIDPRTLAWTDPGANLAISALAPGVGFHVDRADDGSGAVTLGLAETSPGPRLRGSWATAEYVPGHDRYEVRQYGPRRLFDEVRDAYLTWVSWGRPRHDLFGLTVTATGQYLWLGGHDVLDLTSNALASGLSGEGS